MAETYYPYQGSGKIYARVAGTATGRMELGNCSKLNIKIKEEKKNLKDYTKPGGGNYATVSRIDTATLELTLHDLNKTNLARAMFGSEAVVAGAAVVDEVVLGYKDAICPLAHPAATAVVVTNSAATTTYVAGTDYEVRPGGIFVLAAGAITDAQSLKVDYSFVGYNRVEGLTGGAQTLELYCEFLNEANSGKPVLLDFWKVQLSPTKALELLGDKFAELDTEAELLKDPTKTGVGISQYFRARLA